MVSKIPPIPPPMKCVLLTKLKLYIELHGLNKLRCLRIDHVREVFKLAYHGVQ